MGDPRSQLLTPPQRDRVTAIGARDGSGWRRIGAFAPRLRISTKGANAAARSAMLTGLIDLCSGSKPARPLQFLNTVPGSRGSCQRRPIFCSLWKKNNDTQPALPSVQIVSGLTSTSSCREVPRWLPSAEVSVRTSGWQTIVSFQGPSSIPFQTAGYRVVIPADVGHFGYDDGVTGPPTSPSSDCPGQHPQALGR